MYENYTISSSKNVTAVDVDNSILKLTNKMKKNFETTKADFDKYVKQNLTNLKNDIEKNSITANESQIKELLTESQKKMTQDLETEISDKNTNYFNSTASRTKECL